MIGFDSATFSFLALLVKKSNRKKWRKTKFKKFPDLAIKDFKTIFVTGVPSSNISAKLKKFRWPVVIVKLIKGQIFKNNRKIQQKNA